MTRFAGKTVIVTGASRGLGRAIALAFGADGANVWAGFATRADAADETVAAIRAAGGIGAPLRCDITDVAAIDTAIAQVLARHGRIDVLVNAAAVVRDNLFAMSSAEDWDEPLRVNLGGALRISRGVVRPMLAANRGAIVHVGSIAGSRASPGQIGYAAAKGGLEAMTRTLAVELAPRGIRVNAVVPGLCAAGMGQRMDRTRFDERVARIPAGRAGSADEIAAAVLFLASDAASYVIGHSLVVDGGASL